MNNYWSATNAAMMDKVKDALTEEISAGNNEVTDTEPTIISALRCVPKAGSEEVRLIHDCSQPVGFAIIMLILSTPYHAIKLLKAGYYMAKVDLRHAYRSISIHPNNSAATRLKWKFKGASKVTYLVDTKLGYGGHLGQGISHRLTQAVKQFMAKHGYKAIVVYLDDFLIIGAALAECQEFFDCLIELLQELGFDISWRKVVPPAQCLPFWGSLLILSVRPCLCLLISL